MPNPASSRRHTANPIKDTGATKARTRQIVDREPPHGAKRKPASQTVTGQGGSDKGRSQHDVHHTSQLGGVKADAKTPRFKTNIRKGRQVGVRTSEGVSQKLPGTRSRSGRSTTGERRRARGGSRTRGR